MDFMDICVIRFIDRKLICFSRSFSNKDSIDTSDYISAVETIV